MSIAHCLLTTALDHIIVHIWCHFLLGVTAVSLRWVFPRGAAAWVGVTVQHALQLCPDLAGFVSVTHTPLYVDAGSSHDLDTTSGWRL